MLALALATAVMSVLPAAAPSSPMFWRDVPVPAMRHEAIRLTELVSQLAARARFPLHLVCHSHIATDLTLHDINILKATSLGEVFDLVAEQHPGMQARITKRGVVWIAPMAQHIMDAFEEKIHAPSFHGTLDAFMHQFAGRVFSGIGCVEMIGFRTQSSKLKIHLNVDGDVSLLEVLIEGVEDQDCRLELVCLDQVLDNPRKGNNLVMPSLDFSVGDIRKYERHE
ncbi:MAG TPA: hypothetical protein VHZ24_16615 [Pirellulales bacterium]|jgi:hypothetical protein|nr:hypothetical protein [Pirellulales bacterium]